MTSDSLIAAVFDVPSVMLDMETFTFTLGSESDVQYSWPRYILDVEMMPVRGGSAPVFGGSPGRSTFRGCPVFAT